MTTITAMAPRIALALLLAAALPATAVAAPSIHVRPAAVYPGEVVRVSGSAAGCPSGDQVTLLSRAFSPRHEFAGVPAVFASVRADGGFSKRTRIPARRHPGRYRVSGRCGGGNLGVTARLRVRAERSCRAVRVDQMLQPAADGKFGAFAIRTRRTGCVRARRLASRYVREPAARIGRWRCRARTVENQIQRVRCTLGSKRVSFRDVLPSG